MINGTEPIIGPRDVTKNQLVQLIVTQLGGWPVKAVSLWQFESRDPKETVYRFVDERGICMETNKFRKLDPELWSKRLSRDDFLLYFLSGAAKDVIYELGKRDILRKIGAL